MEGVEDDSVVCESWDLLMLDVYIVCIPFYMTEMLLLLDWDISGFFFFLFFLAHFMGVISLMMAFFLQLLGFLCLWYWIPLLKRSCRGIIICSIYMVTYQPIRVHASFPIAFETLPSFRCPFKEEEVEIKEHNQFLHQMISFTANLKLCLQLIFF